MYFSHIRRRRRLPRARNALTATLASIRDERIMYPSQQGKAVLKGAAGIWSPALHVVLRGAQRWEVLLLFFHLLASLLMSGSHIDCHLFLFGDFSPAV